MDELMVQVHWGIPDPRSRWSSSVRYSLARDPRSIAELVESDRGQCSWWSWKDGLKWEIRGKKGDNSERRVTRLWLILNTPADMNPGGGGGWVYCCGNREPQRCRSSFSVLRGCQRARGDSNTLSYGFVCSLELVS